jgi:hypothetical protein
MPKVRETYLPLLFPIPLPIPRVGIGKGIAKARFSLSHRHCPDEPASQPPALITSSESGRLGSKAVAVGQEKTEKTGEKKK